MNRTLASPSPQRARPSWAARTARIVGQPEVVVGAEVEHLATVHRDVRALRALDDALVLPQPRVADAVELGLQPLRISPLHRSPSLPAQLRRVAPPDVRHEIFVEGPLEIVRRAGSPSRAGPRCRRRPRATSRGSACRRGSGAKVIRRAGEGAAHEVGQLARARVEGGDVVDASR